jgi:integrase
VPRRLAADADLDAFLAIQDWRQRCGAEFGVGVTPVFSARHKKSGGLLHPLERDYPYPRALEDVRWVLEQAGVAHAGSYGMHSLRRGCATRLLGAGAPWATVKRLIGWQSDAAMEKYDGRLEELAEEVTRCEARGARARG